MKKFLVFCLMLSMLGISCQLTSATATQTTTTLSETQAAEYLRYRLQEDDIDLQHVEIDWLNMDHDRVFVVKYATDLNPESQPDSFSDQFKHVAFAATIILTYTNTQANLVNVMVEDINSPLTTSNPPLYEVFIERESILARMNDEINDAEFIASWVVIPLPGP